MFRGEYAKDWSEISLGVKEAALWRCIRCGHDHSRETGHVLTVHHFDGDKANNALWNLMALCQRCHLKFQARVDPAQGLLVHPSVWSMPYIAGAFIAGKTPEPLMWDLAGWIKMYTEKGRVWPDWAPKEEANVN